MQKSEILYEPLPIGRMGIRKSDEGVVVTADFSCFAHMLEEYISFGAINIIIPKSAPEITTLDQMPFLLRKRVRIVDDENEIEAVRRLLFQLRSEFNVYISDEDQYLKFPKDLPTEIRMKIINVHSDVKRIALGFNHGIQIDINPRASIESLKFLRARISNGESRIVLAQLEALLRVYGEVKFDAPSPPKGSTPTELISVFDRLVNDVNYIEYSDTISRLALPSTREEALIQLRELARGIRSSDYISAGWNFLSKVLKVWTGFPIPEAKAISSIVKNRSLPPLVDMSDARKQAVAMWKNSDLRNSPLRRDGTPVSGDDICWLPPTPSMEVYSPNDETLSLGTFRELLTAAEKVGYFYSDSSDQKHKDEIM